MEVLETMRPKLDFMLRQFGLDPVKPPSPEEWKHFQEALAHRLEEDAHESTLLGHSLRALSREVQELFTARLSSEGRIAQERNQLRTVISSLGAGLCLLDAEGRVLTLNPEGERIIGYAEEDLAWESFFDRLAGHGENLPHPSHLEEGSSHRVEEGRFIHRDGRQLTVSYVLTPLLQDGESSGAVLVFFDISEQHRLAKRLRESQQLSRMLVQAAPEVIFSLTMKDGALQSLNPAFESLTGWTGEEWLGKPFAQLVHPRDLPQARRQIRRLLRGLRTPPMELRLRTRSGRSVAAEVVCTPLGEDAKITGVLGIARDITARKRAEREMRTAKEAAEAANRAKTDFLANISHELRTPLNAIIGMTGLLLETAIQPEQRDFVETVRTSGDTLLNLVNEILDFSKIESGRLELEAQPFHLPTCIQGAMDLVASTATQRDVQLIHQVLTEGPETVVGDATRVRQVLVNLLNNAVKFTDVGEIRVEAAVRPGDAGTEGGLTVEIAVHDTGIGIPAEHLETIFESFRQVDSSTSRRHGGTGLGLAISRRLVELMGGTIQVASVPGEGSTFTFTFQARPANSRQEVESCRGVSSSAPATSFDTGLAERLPLRILVAEDNVVNQKVILLMLERLGYRVELSTNGMEVLDALERQRYDVVLMDVQMPELDGLDATRTICRRWPPEERPQIIAMTASALAEDRQRCLDAGMHDYVSKPVRVADLQAALERAASGAVPGEASVDAKPELALDTLKMLYGIQPEKVRELVSSFVQHSREALEVIFEGEAEADWEAVALAAHSLRGSAGTLGATGAAEWCARVEGECLDGRGITRQDLHHLKAKVESATEALQEVLEAWQAPP